MIEYTTISRNFMYLRTVFFGTHKNALARMKPCITSGQLTSYCLANEEPSPIKMRALEAHLDLPLGWLERDIQALSKMPTDEFSLVHLLLNQSTSKKEAIRTLLSGTQDMRTGMNGNTSDPSSVTKTQPSP
jgi:hypothetical protein